MVRGLKPFSIMTTSTPVGGNDTGIIWRLFHTFCRLRSARARLISCIWRVLGFVSSIWNTSSSSIISQSLSLVYSFGQTPDWLPICCCCCCCCCLFLFSLAADFITCFRICVRVVFEMARPSGPLFTQIKSIVILISLAARVAPGRASNRKKNTKEVSLLGEQKSDVAKKDGLQDSYPKDFVDEKTNPPVVCVRLSPPQLSIRFSGSSSLLINCGFISPAFSSSTHWVDPMLATPL